MMDFSNACLYPPHLQPGWIFLSNGGLVHVFLAHSGSPIPIDPRPSTVDSLELQRRFLWPVGGHPARDAFATGLGETLLQLAREYDIGVRSVGLYRQGHQFAPEESPVTVVVTLRREFRIVYQHTGEYSAGIDAYLFQARALLDDWYVVTHMLLSLTTNPPVS